MANTHTTLAQAKSQLAARLGDTSKVFWTDGELEVYLIEALRVWGAASLQWIERGLLTPIDDQAFYDLPSSVSGSLITQIVLDQDLAKVIEYHFMEPPTPSSWTGSEQFTLLDIQNALQGRLNEFLLEAGYGLSTYSVIVTSGTEFVSLPDTTVEVVRAVWKTLDGEYKPLSQSDPFQNQYSFPSWAQNPGVPMTYSTVARSPLRLQLVPETIDNGTLELVVISTGTALDLTTGVLLGIPDDLAWVIKWGAIADLLTKDGTARDDPRAQYAERRWKEGIELAKLYPSFISARADNRLIRVAALEDMDTIVPRWQESNDSPQTDIIPCGYDLIALYPVPDNTATQITLDVARKAVLPASDSDYIDVGRDFIGTILDYAQHLATFKLGGVEFMETASYYDKMVAMAALQNSRLMAQASMFEALIQSSELEDIAKPRFKEAGDGLR